MGNVSVCRILFVSVNNNYSLTIAHFVYNGLCNNTANIQLRNQFQKCENGRPLHIYNKI